MKFSTTVSEDTICSVFTYVRTMDVTKYTPKGSADVYEYRSAGFLATLIKHKCEPWTGQWDFECYRFDDTQASFKMYNVDSLDRIVAMLYALGQTDAAAVLGHKLFAGTLVLEDLKID